MNTKFPILSTVSKLFKFGGWLTVLVGIYYLLYEGIIEPNLPNHSFNPKDTMQIIQGVSFIASGLFAVALGEIIGVLFAIEENTIKNSNSHLNQIYNVLSSIEKSLSNNQNTIKYHNDKEQEKSAKVENGKDITENCYKCKKEFPLSKLKKIDKVTNRFFCESCYPM